MSSEPPPTSPEDDHAAGTNATERDRPANAPPDQGPTFPRAGALGPGEADAGHPPAGQGGDVQVVADAVLASFVDGLGLEDVALALAVLVNRAATRLHNLSRAEAAARKDQPAWAAWAQLQNASRTLLLQASTCRDLAARLAGRRR